MNEEILKIIYDYSRNNKIIDKRFVDKIISLYSSYYDIDKYIKHVEYKNISEDNENNIAGYSYRNKEIYIFTNRFIEEIERKSNLSKYVPINQFVFLKNVELTHIILHELEHVLQAKIMTEKQTIESEILKLSGISKSTEIISLKLRNSGLDSDLIKKVLKCKLNKYYEFYNYAPPERLADFNAHKKMVNILSPIQKSIPKIYDGEVIKMGQIKIKGYMYNNEIVSPTRLFLIQQGEEHSLSNFDWYDKDTKVSLIKSKKNYDEYERMKLGLPIDEKEYKKEDKKIKRLLSRL